jgi:hypothetical protein
MTLRTDAIGARASRRSSKVFPSGVFGSKPESSAATKAFYGGAHKAMCIQHNIMEMHDGEAAKVLFESLLDEAWSFIREAQEAVGE